MSKRLWAVVGLFAGIAVMLGVWMLMSTDPTTGAAAHRGKAPPGFKPQMKRFEDDPALLKNRLLPRAKLQRPPRELRRVTASTDAPLPATDGPAAPPPGVFPLDQDGVKAAIGDRMADIEACYETALFHTPGLSGQLTLAMEVVPVAGQPFATVESVDAESDLDATVFEGCVATIFEELKFATTEPTTLRYPLHFEAGEE